MRIKMRMMIIVGLIFVLVGVELTEGWGGPFADLAEPGEARIMGIDSLKAILHYRVKQTRRPSVGRSRQAQRLQNKTRQKKKPSVAEILSDRVNKEKTEQREINRDVEVVQSSPGQYVSAEYFPTAAGTTWTYLVNGRRTSKVKVLPELAIVRGVETSIASNTKTGVSVCYTSDDDGILIHRQLFPNVYLQRAGISDLIVTFIPPIRLADRIVGVGQTAYSIGTAQYTLVPQGRVIDLDYTATYSLQTLKEVAVPAGTFDTLLFQGTLTISGDLESETFYLTKSIGLVKDVVKFNDQKKTVELNVTETEQ